MVLLKDDLFFDCGLLARGNMTLLWALKADLRCIE